ncbi:acetate/propionate family kinase [Alcaligenaceae bacterium]|nr:acetate/propionate family kinase [Alcaligenaceae bacterium]
MNDVILVVNAGSSSLKFQVHEITGVNDLSFMLGGQVSGIGGGRPSFRVKDGQGAVLDDRAYEPGQVPDLSAAQDIMASWLQQRIPAPPAAVGHRIVHGGQRMTRSVLVSQDILEYLDSLVPLAPLHQHNNLAPVHVIFEHWPEIRQVACFDTAFHRTQDKVVERFALPQEFYDQGVRRYGFHGLSYQYIAGRLAEILPEVARGRVIAAHLGSGASACALVNGVSRETTMGFTALDGLPMGTRPGRLDAGVVLWMLEQGMGHDEIQDLLYNRSGMKGLSGISNDMRTLLASEETSARLAVDYFNYRVAESIAGLCVAAEGLDALVFTAGVGENSPEIRAGICRRLEWLGVRLDETANSGNQLRISAPDSRIGVYVVPTNEELVIARQTSDVIHGML